MTRIFPALAGATALLAPWTAAAHPDHATGGPFGPAHFWTDPFHVALAAGAVAAALLLRRAVGRRARLRARR